MMDLLLIGGTMMRKTPRLQRSLFNVPATVTVIILPQNIQTAPLKPLVQALLTDLIDGQRRVAAVLGQNVEVKS
jgi:hypothetical protein